MPLSMAQIQAAIERDRIAAAGPSLADRFVVPPFTILDARQGYWQDRKRQWLAMGIQGELGRGEVLLYGDSPAVTEPGLNYYRNQQAVETGRRPVPNGSRRSQAGDGAWKSSYGSSARPSNLLGLSDQTEDYRKNAGQYRKHRNEAIPGGAGEGSVYRDKGNRYGRTFGQDMMRGEYAVGDAARKAADQASNLMGKSKTPDWATGTGTENMAAGTSIFDPVLCELVYRWFGYPGGSVLDPFAGESVKGLVAAKLGFQYTGIEVRPEQVAANQMQANALNLTPQWLQGDSAALDTLIPFDTEYDLIFTSPPYYDLERYSDRADDGSTAQTYEEFMVWYRDIFDQAVRHLAENRFLVVKVGDIRDKHGAYRNFVGDTISVFLDLGLSYYNEAILIMPAGSLPIRIGRQFQNYRKLGKTHQNVLVFYNGDPRTIKDVFPLLGTEGYGNGLDAPRTRDDRETDQSPGD